MNSVLIDTSSWISHFQGKNKNLEPILNSSVVFIHEFILGEFCLGHLKSSHKLNIFQLFNALRKIPTSEHHDVFEFTQEFKLAGKGIGWIDTHLLHSCYINNMLLVTEDRKLKNISDKLLK